jgi:hypothetical protein
MVFLGVLYILNLVILSRNHRVLLFLKDLCVALHTVITYDVLRGVEPKYTFEDFEKCVWSQKKMIYTFWVTEKRKMFYDPGFYDYVERYTSSKTKI